ncbi:MAG: DNA repair protein RecN [Nitrospirae bacterium]|nr:DNA repair protein RecN [Nitrospirota bacterium]
MLRELRIKNLAIIDDLTVTFGKGLTVLTGETGAGKSIIVDALGLALGDRAQSEMIKSGRPEASVQALFDLDRPPLLEAMDIDTSEGVLIRRVISAAGKNRAYINDTAVTLQTLSEFGRSVVDIMSQHEHQNLMSSANQRETLDRYGRLQQVKDRTAALYREVLDLKDRYVRLKEKVGERAQRLDLLKFQIDEIDSADLSPGEWESLEQEKKVLSNLGRLGGLAESAYSLLYEAEGSCAEKLSRVRALLREMCQMDGVVEEALHTVDSAVPLIEDVSIQIRAYKDRYDADPGRLGFIEERLETLRRLQRKYGGDTETILKYRNDAAGEAEGLESTDDRLAELGRELDLKEGELTASATALSGMRKKTALELSRLISDNLRELAFGAAAFSVDVSAESAAEGGPKIGPAGFDRIEFRFTANPGEPMKPLSRIISGGELSRVMLALKTVLAGVDNTPVLIFDEVDAGIGGSAAESVGNKLDLLSESHQVICITHLPQIATYGDLHLKIEKNAAGKNVSVEVRELSGAERKNEIARMLSGNITDIALKHAGELLGKGR